MEEEEAAKKQLALSYTIPRHLNFKPIPATPKPKINIIHKPVDCDLCSWGFLPFSIITAPPVIIRMDSIQLPIKSEREWNRYFDDVDDRLKTLDLRP